VPQLSLQADYSVNLPAAPDAPIDLRRSACGAARSGASSVWGVEATLNTYQQWQSVGGSGYAIAPASQITSGNIIPPDVELVQIDMTYDQGDIVS
jgi:hypothetical protein